MITIQKDPKSYKKRLQNTVLTEFSTATAKGRAVYRTTKWRRLREVKLISDPLCERCALMGRSSLSEEVHHIVRIQDDIRLAYDYYNLAALCSACHHEVHEQINHGKQDKYINEIYENRKALE